MALPPPDWQRIADMRAWCERGQRHLSGRTREELERDELFQDGLLRCLSIIGEAAFKLSRPTQQCFPAVPWLRIAAFRHILVHDYGSVNLDRVWQVASTELGPLIQTLSALLDEHPPEA